jgi:hypothetical protein
VELASLKVPRATRISKGHTEKVATDIPPVIER